MFPHQPIPPAHRFHAPWQPAHAVPHAGLHQGHQPAAQGAGGGANIAELLALRPNGPHDRLPPGFNALAWALKHRLVVNRHAAPLVLPRSPFPLSGYLRLHGFSAPWRDHLNAIEAQVGHKRLDRLGKVMTHANHLARGRAKDCWRLDDGRVLLVQERSGMPVPHDLALLKMLEEAGFPVVKVWQAGTLPSRYASGNGHVGRSEAMVQERLDGFFSFESADRAMFHGVLRSRRFNTDTLASLRQIRAGIQRHGVAIGGLQGGLAEDGRFVLTAPTGLHTLAQTGVRDQKALATLDRLIAEAQRSLYGY